MNPFLDINSDASQALPRVCVKRDELQQTDWGKHPKRKSEKSFVGLETQPKNVHSLGPPVFLVSPDRPPSADYPRFISISGCESWLNNESNGISLWWRLQCL